MEIKTTVKTHETKRQLRPYKSEEKVCVRFPLFWTSREEVPLLMGPFNFGGSMNKPLHEIYKDLTANEQIEEIEIQKNKALILVYVSLLLAVSFLLMLILTVKAHAGENERQIVAQVIAAEACSEGEVGMRAVANTIANRVRNHNKTPYQIVTARNQYYGYTNKNREKIYKGCKETADYLAENLMSIEDITDGAEFFLLPNESRRRWHGKKTVTVKSHTFYREAK